MPERNYRTRTGCDRLSATPSSSSDRSAEWKSPTKTLPRPLTNRRRQLAVFHTLCRSPPRPSSLSSSLLCLLLSNAERFSPRIFPFYPPENRGLIRTCHLSFLSQSTIHLPCPSPYDPGYAVRSTCSPYLRPDPGAFDPVWVGGDSIKRSRRSWYDTRSAPSLPPQSKRAARGGAVRST